MHPSENEGFKIGPIERDGKGLGLDPEKVLVKEALSEAHRGIMTGEQATEEEARKLWTVLRAKMLAELKGDKSRE